MSSEELNEKELVYKHPQKVYSESENKEKSISNQFINEKQDKVKYPKIVFLIIVNEFCERFSYYGLRTVLFLYLTGFIKIEQNSATAIYHAFTVLCYFTPVIGAIVADGYLGLYRTILSVSILYAVGEIILTLTSIKPLGAPNIVGPAIALIIIAAGTGGIKPCVSAFGGNQFKPSQKKYLETFFSIFYLSINIGSTIGTILTPIFRNDVKCFGNDCYPLAFGIPALFMLTAIVIFVIGTPFYNRDDEKLKKNGKNVIGQTIGCFYHAIKNKVFKRNNFEKKEHWLDYADSKYNSEMITDVKAFYKVLIVFLPLPIFWALYDQQGSRWTSQAQQLNGRLGSFTIKPDQFQAINPVFIVALVPLFDFVIYPLFSKINFLKTHLQRMSVGLLFAILSFIIAAVLESQMQKSIHNLNPSNQIKLINLSPCDITFYSNSSNEKFYEISKSTNLKNEPIVMPNQLLRLLQNKNMTSFNLKSNCYNNKLQLTNNIVIDRKNLPKTIFLYLSNNKIKSFDIPHDNKNSLIGFSQIRIIQFNTSSFGNLIPSLSNKIINYDSSKFDSNLTSYLQVDYSEYKLNINNEKGEDLLKANLLLETCGTYTVLLYPNEFNSTALSYVFLTDVYPNGIHIGWQIIQIFVMTVGEVMFSISGLSFAYSQAPASMKSVLQALWCLTVAFGNLVVVIVAEAKFLSNQVYEYILFAGLLGIATIAFIILAWFYKYDKHDDIEKDEPTQQTDSDSDLPSKEPPPTAINHKYSTDSEIQLVQMSALDPN